MQGIDQFTYRQNIRNKSPKSILHDEDEDVQEGDEDDDRSFSSNNHEGSSFDEKQFYQKFKTSLFYHDNHPSYAQNNYKQHESMAAPP